MKNKLFSKALSGTLIIMAFLTVLSSCSENKTQLKGDMVLWYDKPAVQWLDATPVGNGLVAGMIFGKTQQERIALNESSFWMGSPHNYDNPNAGAHFEYIKEQIFAGKYAEMGDYITENFYGTPECQVAYQPIGDLLLDFLNVDETAVTNYRRELDMETGISTVTYTSGGITYKREVFVSYPDKIMVVRVSTDKKKSLNMQASVNSAFTDKISAGAVGELIIDGQWKTIPPPATRNSTNMWISIPEGLGIKFRTVVKAIPEGGTAKILNEKINIDDADAVTFYVSIATSFKNYNDISANQIERSNNILAAVKGKSLDKLRKRHKEDFLALMGRVHLTLEGNPELTEKPINERIALVRSGGLDINLEALVFQFGRYALVSSSRVGGQAANLQGIWNESLFPPWGSKYTTNINIQMNYWPAEVTNLSECLQPLFDLVQDLSETGSRTAKTYYGIDKGWVTHHNTDLWRGTAPVDYARSGMWPLGGAWLATHLCEHFNYHSDLEFLKKYYPVIKGSAEFLLNYLVEHPSLGYLVTPFSISPEHGFFYMDGNIRKQAWVAPAPTMDIAIMRDLFPYVIQYSEILGVDADLRNSLKSALENLPPYQISKDGTIQSWLEDFERNPDGHNMSANYGFFPGKDILLRNPSDATLIEAIKRWVEPRRMGGSWQSEWDLCNWARLERGDKTAQSITASTRRAALNLHRDGASNQTDASFGLTAGIAEALLQSHADEIALLPALPVTWPNGSITGLRARGGYEVSIEWKDGKLLSADIKNINGKESIPVRYKEQVKTINVKPGKSLIVVF